LSKAALETGPAAADSEERDFLWRYGLAAFLLCLVAESFVARRTV